MSSLETLAIRDKVLGVVDERGYLYPMLLNSNPELPIWTQCINKATFTEVANLRKVVCNKNLRIIGKHTFVNGGSLEEIEFNDGLLEICSEVFANTKIEYLSLPSSLINLDDYTFSRMYSLKHIKFSSGQTRVLPACFFMLSSLEKVELAKECVEIHNFAFSSSGIRTINLPKGLLTIGKEAFSNCKNLTDIVIPNSCERIGTGAFADCNKLKEIKFPDRFTKDDIRIIMRQE